MRQRGSQRIRPQPVSNDGSPVDPSVLEPASRSNQSADAISKKYSDADENVTEVRTASNDDATIPAAHEYLRCFNERRTKSERYFL